MMGEEEFAELERGLGDVEGAMRAGPGGPIQRALDAGGG